MVSEVAKLPDSSKAAAVGRWLLRAVNEISGIASGIDVSLFEGKRINR